MTSCTGNRAICVANGVGTEYVSGCHISPPTSEGPKTKPKPGIITKVPGPAKRIVRRAIANHKEAYGKTAICFNVTVIQ